MILRTTIALTCLALWPSGRAEAYSEIVPKDAITVPTQGKARGRIEANRLKVLSHLDNLLNADPRDVAAAKARVLTMPLHLIDAFLKRGQDGFVTMSKPGARGVRLLPVRPGGYGRPLVLEAGRFSTGQRAKVRPARSFNRRSAR